MLLKSTKTKKLINPKDILESFLLDFFNLSKNITFLDGQGKSHGIQTQTTYKVSVTQIWSATHLMAGTNFQKKTLDVAREVYKEIKKLRCKKFYSYPMGVGATDFSCQVLYRGLQTIRH